MSYRCQKCNYAVPSGIPQIKRVVKTRRKTYTKTVEGRHGPMEIVLGQGHETVKELALCRRCNKRLNKSE
jgi:hypothetical protein